MGKPAPIQTPNGFTRWMNITADDADQIIELISEGMPPDTATRQVGTSMTQFKRLMRRQPELAERFQQAMEEGGEAFHHSLRSVLYWHVFEGLEYKAARDMAIIYLPEWSALKNQRFEVGLTPETMEHQLKELFGPDLASVTTEQLEQKLLELEAGDNGDG